MTGCGFYYPPTETSAVWRGEAGFQPEAPLGPAVFAASKHLARLEYVDHTSKPNTWETETGGLQV